jgi:hypothetical protein
MCIPSPDFSHDGAPHDALSDDEASHDAPFHTSAAPFPYDPNSRRSSVMDLTGDPDDPEVGGLLVRGDKKEG